MQAPNKSFSQKLRAIAPVRLWVALLLLLLLFVVALVFIIVREEKLLNRSLDTIRVIESEVQQHNNIFASPVSLVGVFILAASGVNMVALSRASMGSRAAAVAEAVAVAAPKPTTWIGKRLPWLAAAKPGTGHEWVLYAINFFMLYQGITVWRGWQLSPARNFMVRFQQSSVNRFFHNRSLRQIQRAAAKELAASAASRGGAQAPKALG
ncbi:hypothetical protein TeGR_g2704 [Tetraparma gracilis]|uniref:Uncharacterized protein n=1 Tax=Tetraparma gracilis TaxID=2962635 RepID=A0ABQ6NEW9_9STRA|nr:hypothetical protein TeGR_g2704 [Tetraparma gracilis]